MSFFPVACFSCRKRIGHLHEPYLALINTQPESKGETISELVALDKLKIIRPCCRRMFTTHADVEKYLLLYPTYPNRIQRLNKVSMIDVDDSESEDEKNEENAEDEEESVEEDNEEDEPSESDSD